MVSPVRLAMTAKQPEGDTGIRASWDIKQLATPPSTGLREHPRVD